ncbi:unnamed protein product [Prunus armeniaca]
MDLLLLTLGTFWVQLHVVPTFCMTIIVAKAIGAILGEVLWVDNRDEGGYQLAGQFYRFFHTPYIDSFTPHITLQFILLNKLVYG